MSKIQPKLVCGEMNSVNSCCKMKKMKKIKTEKSKIDRLVVIGYIEHMKNRIFAKRTTIRTPTAYTTQRNTTQHNKHSVVHQLQYHDKSITEYGIIITLPGTATRRDNNLFTRSDTRSSHGTARLPPESPPVFSNS